MKVTDVRITPPLGPRRWVLLRIDTDEGISGLGEWAPADAASGASPARFAALKEMLLGQDPTNINRLHHERQPERGLWSMGGLGAGVEIALWDIAGKALGVPLWQLLGGKLRDRIRMYCDCHGGAFWTAESFARRWRETRERGELDPAYRVEAFVEMARRVVGEGFTCIKFDADFASPWKMDPYDRSIAPREGEQIVRAMEAVREAIGPHVDLALDLHGAYNTPDALRLCRQLEGLNLLWIEDPVRWEWGNVDAMVKICEQSRVPICTGELRYGAKQHRELIVKQACDLLEPDIPRSGGPIEIRRIAEMAEMYYMSIAPHNMTSTVTAIAAAHICATIPNFLALEYHSHDIPLWSEMLDLKDPIQEGYIAVPDGPGLGVALDEGAIAASLGEGEELWS